MLRNLSSGKANLGVYFPAIKGMSDAAAADGHYADATGVTGDFLFELAGVVNNPFVGI